MEYALILCFDDPSENFFSAIISDIAHQLGKSHMLPDRFPPHITLSLVKSQNFQDIVHLFDEHINAFTAGDVTWASLGTFVPHVLFAAPILNEYLLEMCTQANELLEHLPQCKRNAYYLPYQWVPHTTLAEHLTVDELQSCFALASSKFSAISGRANRLILAECAAYKEIISWQL